MRLWFFLFLLLLAGCRSERAALTLPANKLQTAPHVLSRENQPDSGAVVTLHQASRSLLPHFIAGTSPWTTSRPGKRPLTKYGQPRRDVNRSVIAARMLARLRYLPATASARQARLLPHSQPTPTPGPDSAPLSFGTRLLGWTLGVIGLALIVGSFIIGIHLGGWAGFGIFLLTFLGGILLAMFGGLILGEFP